MERRHQDWLNIFYMPHTEAGQRVLELVRNNRKKAWKSQGRHTPSGNGMTYISLLSDVWVIYCFTSG